MRRGFVQGLLGLAGGAAASLWAAQPSHGQTPSARDLLERASARHAAVASLCADFEQRLELTLLGEERRGSGRLCHKRPGLFAMRFAEPAGDAIVADGTWVWLYHPSMEAGQVVRFAAGATAPEHDLFSQFLENPAEKFVSSYLGPETLASGVAHRVLLAPRAPEGFVSAELWIDARDHVLRRVRVEDENGSIRTVSLTRVEGDPDDLDENWFRFVPPPGATVITR